VSKEAPAAGYPGRPLEDQLAAMAGEEAAPGQMPLTLPLPATMNGPKAEMNSGRVFALHLRRPPAVAVSGGSGRR